MDGLQVNPYNRYDQKLTVKAPQKSLCYPEYYDSPPGVDTKSYHSRGKMGKISDPEGGSNASALGRIFVDWSFIKSFLVGNKLIHRVFMS